MILLDFKSYINESSNIDNYVDLYLSQRFINALFKINKTNKIFQELSKLFLDLNVGLCKGKFDVSFIDATDKDDTISYISSNRAKPILDKYKSIKREQEGINLCWINYRQEQKLSRFINRLFPGEFKQIEIEDFVKEYKAWFVGDKSLEAFEIVKGKDVTKYYYGERYSDEATGQLQKSCMKQIERSKFFGIYEENPEKMNMLILKDKKDNIYGRANLWYLDSPSDRVFMDRIYTTYDWQIKLFIDYAIRNNYIYKSRQIYGGSVIPVIIDGKKEKITMTVNLKPKSYRYYPYVDTLQFYNPEDGTLTSDIKKFHDKKYLTLVLASGEAYQDDGRSFKIDYLGRIVHSEFVVWSDFDQSYVHKNDAILLDYRGDYVTPEHDFIKVRNIVCLKEDIEKDENGNYRLKKNF